MRNKIKFILFEMIFVVFFILLSAVLLNPSIKNGQINEPVNQLLHNNSQPTSERTDTSSTSSDSDNSSSEISKAENKPNISDWKLILANENHPLEAELINSIKTKSLENGLSVDERIYEPLTKMLNDAKSKGYDLIVCSGYRSYDKQVSLFNNRVKRYENTGYSQEEAYKKAKTSVAVPGTSEHHTGLAVDIVSVDYQNLDDSMLSRPEIKWLYENCEKYGFIVRYPNGKSDITGIIHEPWHYRYVGVEAATEIMDKGICLEEYLKLN